MKKQSLGIIGLGAFGAFMARHLAPHFDLVLHDAHKSTDKLAKACRAKSGGIIAVGACKIIVIAVPVELSAE